MALRTQSSSSGSHAGYSAMTSSSHQQQQHPHSAPSYRLQHSSVSSGAGANATHRNAPVTRHSDPAHPYQRAVREKGLPTLDSLLALFSFTVEAIKLPPSAVSDSLGVVLGYQLDWSVTTQPSDVSVDGSDDEDDWVLASGQSPLAFAAGDEVHFKYTGNAELPLPRSLPGVHTVGGNASRPRPKAPTGEANDQPLSYGPHAFPRLVIDLTARMLDGPASTEGYSSSYPDEGDNSHSTASYCVGTLALDLGPHVPRHTAAQLAALSASPLSAAVAIKPLRQRATLYLEQCIYQSPPAMIRLLVEGAIRFGGQGQNTTDTWASASMDDYGAAINAKLLHGGATATKAHMPQMNHVAPDTTHNTADVRAHALDGVEIARRRAAQVRAKAREEAERQRTERLTLGQRRAAAMAHVAQSANVSRTHTPSNAKRAAPNPNPSPFPSLYTANEGGHLKGARSAFASAAPSSPQPSTRGTAYKREESYYQDGRHATRGGDGGGSLIADMEGSPASPSVPPVPNQSVPLASPQPLHPSRVQPVSASSGQGYCGGDGLSPARAIGSTDGGDEGMRSPSLTHDILQALHRSNAALKEDNERLKRALEQRLLGVSAHASGHPSSSAASGAPPPSTLTFAGRHLEYGQSPPLPPPFPPHPHGGGAHQTLLSSPSLLLFGGGGGANINTINDTLISHDYSLALSNGFSSPLHGGDGRNGYGNSGRSGGDTRAPSMTAALSAVEELAALRQEIARMEERHREAMDAENKASTTKAEALERKLEEVHSSERHLKEEVGRLEAALESATTRGRQSAENAASETRDLRERLLISEKKQRDLTKQLNRLEVSERDSQRLAEDLKEKHEKEAEARKAAEERAVTVLRECTEKVERYEASLRIGQQELTRLHAYGEELNVKCRELAALVQSQAAMLEKRKEKILELRGIIAINEKHKNNSGPTLEDIGEPSQIVSRRHLTSHHQQHSSDPNPAGPAGLAGATAGGSFYTTANHAANTHRHVDESSRQLHYPSSSTGLSASRSNSAVVGGEDRARQTTTDTLKGLGASSPLRDLSRMLANQQYYQHQQQAQAHMAHPPPPPPPQSVPTQPQSREGEDRRRGSTVANGGGERTPSANLASEWDVNNNAAVLENSPLQIREEGRDGAAEPSPTSVFVYKQPYAKEGQFIGVSVPSRHSPPPYGSTRSQTTPGRQQQQQQYYYHPYGSFAAHGYEGERPSQLRENSVGSGRRSVPPSEDPDL